MLMVGIFNLFKTSVMKKIIILLTFLLLAFNFSFAQKAPYNVVIDVTSGDTVVHKMAMNWVREITTIAPDANVELVFFGKGLPMITQGKSTVADSVIKYAAMKNVSFKVCEVAMKNNSVDKSQLLNGVKTVPDGIYEIVSREHEGWGYVKAAR
jgi:intracellular sulfur oxidation DsrE/DsrF family protein